MIDELTDSALEQRLRATLSEMIPKLLDATARDHATDGAVLHTGLISDTPAPTTEIPLTVASPGRWPRRKALTALLSVAAAVALVAVVTRPGEQGPSDSAADPGTTEAPGGATPPSWWTAVRPLIPTRFESIALLGSGRIVALDAGSGTSLDVRLWTEFGEERGSGQELDGGWMTIDATGLGAEVFCSVGVNSPGGWVRDRCALTTADGLSSDDLLAIATSFLDRSLLDVLDVEPTSLVRPIEQWAGVVLERLPELTVSSIGGGANEAWVLFDNDKTSIRYVAGVLPAPSAVEVGEWTKYADVAATWMIAPSGEAFQIVSTQQDDAWLTRLATVAQEVLAMSTAQAAEQARPVPFPPAAVTTTVATTTSLPAVPESPTSRMLPTDMQGIDEVVTEFTSAEAGGMATIRQFVGGGVNPAVLLLIWSPSGSESAADIVRGTWDATQRSSWPSFRRTVAGPAGQDVMVAAGGLPQDQFDAVADSLRVDPATSAVTIDGSLAGLTELTMLDTPALGYRASWSAGVELTVQSGYGLDVLGAALSWPVTRIETDRGVLFAATDALDPTAVQVGGVIDGVAVNLSTAGLSQEQAIAMARSITPMSDAEWSRRVPGARCITQYYVVQEGDLPKDVAQAFGVPLEQLQLGNEGMPGFDDWAVGLRIAIPPAVCR